MSKRAPGPWRVDGQAVISDDGYIAAKVLNPANAQLIAAAPEMLRVLEQVQILLESRESVDPSLCEPGVPRTVLEEKFVSHWAKEVRSAIAKARGEK